jgi:hypothetical protein
MHINTNMVLENPTDVCSFGSRKQSTLLLEIEQAAHARTHIPTWPLTEAIIPLGTPPGVPLIGFQQAASSTAQPQSSHWVCTCAYIYIYIYGWPDPYIYTVYDRIFGDFPAKITVYIHRIWPCIWWFPCQKYRIYTVYIGYWPTLHIYACEAKNVVSIRGFVLWTPSFHQCCAPDAWRRQW